MKTLKELLFVLRHMGYFIRLHRAVKAEEQHTA